MREVLDPGELPHVVVRLRKLMSEYYACEFILSGSLEAIDPKAEDQANSLRLQMKDTANGIYELLERLEGLPAYARLRKDYLT